MNTNSFPRVLVIAGSDSGGGAGIQADIKTLTRFGVYAATAITAVTVQSTLGVSAIHEIPANIITGQIKAVLDDIGADVIKIGMVGGEDVIAAVAEAVKDFAGPIILDPVMVATSGDTLLPPSALTALKEKLLPLASIVTPNVPEAELLTGLEINNADDLVSAGEAILAMGAGAAGMKGGHLGSDKEKDGLLSDVLVMADRSAAYKKPRFDTRSTHGTGCTFASALAAGMANGQGVKSAFRDAQAFVHSAIERAPDLGSGHGPLGHIDADVPVGHLV